MPKANSARKVHTASWLSLSPELDGQCLSCVTRLFHGHFSFSEVPARWAPPPDLCEDCAGAAALLGHTLGPRLQTGTW